MNIGDNANRLLVSFKSFLESVKRVIKWIPVIWKDRDWDEHYLIKIMQFKLQQMAELHMKEGVTVNRFETAEEILHAIHLLELTMMEDLHDDKMNEAELQMKRREEALKYIGEYMSSWWD